MEVKTYSLKVSGTQSYTLKCGPMRVVWSGRVEGDTMIIVGKRKPLLRWWAELLVWHTWKRWRKTRIWISNSSSGPRVKSS